MGYLVAIYRYPDTKFKGTTNYMRPRDLLASTKISTCFFLGGGWRSESGCKFRLGTMYLNKPIKISHTDWYLHRDKGIIIAWISWYAKAVIIRHGSSRLRPELMPNGEKTPNQNFWYLRFAHKHSPNIIYKIGIIIVESFGPFVKMDGEMTMQTWWYTCVASTSQVLVYSCQWKRARITI